MRWNRPGRMWGLFVLALAHGLLYLALIPPWQGPDEIAHFEYAHLLARHGRPLTPADASPALEAEIIESLYTHRAWDFVFQPAPAQIPARLAAAPFFGQSRTLGRFSLAYAPYALLARPLLNQPVAVQLYALRLVSVLSGALVVVLAYQTARLLEPERPALAYGAAALVLLLPQHAFLHATVSDGHLAELLASAALFQLVAAQRLGLTRGRVLLAVLASAGALLSKATAYFLAPLGLVLAADWLWRRLRGVRQARAGTAGPAAAGSRAVGAQPPRRPLATLVVGAILLVLPLALLPTLSAQPLAMARQVLIDGAEPGGMGAHALSLAVSGQLRAVILGTFMSFWATFGWMAAPLPGAWYVGLGAACLLSALGWARALQGRRAGDDVPASYGLLALAAALSLSLIWGWVLVSSIGRHAYQGRYLFGALVPIALLLVRGWLGLALARRAPAALALLVGGLVLLDAAALLVVLVPFFRGAASAFG